MRVSIEKPTMFCILLLLLSIPLSSPRSTDCRTKENFIFNLSYELDVELSFFCQFRFSEKTYLYVHAVPAKLAIRLIEEFSGTKTITKYAPLRDIVFETEKTIPMKIDRKGETVFEVKLTPDQGNNKPIYEGLKTEYSEEAMNQRKEHKAFFSDLISKRDKFLETLEKKTDLQAKATGKKMTAEDRKALTQSLTEIEKACEGLEKKKGKFSTEFVNNQSEKASLFPTEQEAELDLYKLGFDRIIDSLKAREREIKQTIEEQFPAAKKSKVGEFMTQVKGKIGSAIGAVLHSRQLI